MTEQRAVLVTGATGNQGGAVARALLARGHRVLAMTRDPRSEAALRLEQAGARLVEADFDDAARLRAALTAEGRRRIDVASDELGPARMAEILTEVGYSADIPALHSEFPQVGWVTFEEWAKTVAWDAPAGPEAGA
jgi:nucleoside-diphosphate-sugar epimerase